MKLKRIALLILPIFILISCSDNKNDLDYVPVDSPKSFKVLGFCAPAPENALNSKYAIVNKTIAEVNFDYANNNYYYRASKSLDDLFELNNIIIEEEISNDINEDILEKFDNIITEDFKNNIIIKNNSNNKKVILWNIDNINYSLLSNSENKDIEKLALILMQNKLNAN